MNYAAKMETKLCRICGKLGQNFVHIFKTEGLKNKIETCLPIIVSQHSLLPDTICGECSENVDNFYSFIKNCLQNIIILEAQYDITESCLKTKRKFEKGCYADFSACKLDKGMQTDDYLDILLGQSKDFDFNYSVTSKIFGKDNAMFDTIRKNNALVDYDIESDTSSESAAVETGQVIIGQKIEVMSKINKYVDSILSSTNTFPNKHYFDDQENLLINEISQRKRKADIGEIENTRTKMFKIDNSNRRKNKQPKKLDYVGNQLTFGTLEKLAHQDTEPTDVNGSSSLTEQPLQENGISVQILPQICLLCDTPFSGPAALAAHVFETHGIDMAEIVSSTAEAAQTTDKKKKIPNLVKISDLKISESSDETQIEDHQDGPPTLSPTFVCPNCPAVFSTKTDLFIHLRLTHQEIAAFLCGICLHSTTSHQNLKLHLAICSKHHSITTRYICQICLYGDDNFKTLETHILVHDFLLDLCKKQAKMFDPADYIDANPHYANLEGASPGSKSLTCTECGQSNFQTFKEFSTHRRSQHSIFHCDLCNKFYGRNSHLWKHVNRLHKGHPSITCQLCYKTSASKYHLAQHFNKIHSAKNCATKQPKASSDDFMSQKFQAFDFQSVKQSFMKQEIIEQEKRSSINEEDDEEDYEMAKLVLAPKEIDTSSNLYTNIITNYTPPANEGEFKCPKCSKGFHKKTLLKKHKKNCRPRLQKDLLTRCKSCARIFKDRQSLAKHLVNYHSEYACEICSQKVQSKCEIVSHIRFTHPSCHLVCVICGNILRSRADLAEHINDHMNSYVCQFCADALPSKIKLKMHILSLHRKILSLSCGVCLKLFETQHILRDHVRLVHKEQLAPLTSCPVCGKNYGSKWKTYDHLNKSHGRIFKACKTCLEIFDTDGQLEMHCEQAHANGNPASVATCKKEAFSSVVQAPKYETESEQEENEASEEDEFNDELEENNEINKVDINAILQEAKLSLLEKRLLGKKINDDVKEPLVVENSNPQQNSSKRTVYVNSNDPSFCEICLKTWPAKKHLWQHYIRCHKSVAATVCGICLKANADYATLQTHLQENHPNLLHGQGFGSNFICRICGRYHNASSKLKLHMAIHENFDWGLLDEKPKAKIETNGYLKEDEINYESLIEQVECSSQSEGESELKQDSSSEDEESCSEDEDENSLEAQMLQNMKHELKVEHESSSSTSDGSSSSFSDEPEAEVEAEIKSENVSDVYDSTIDSEVNGGLFQCKSEELDSAIQSISYECMEQVVDEVEDDFCDLQSHSLNENEIESAVGSIL